MCYMNWDLRVSARCWPSTNLHKTKMFWQFVLLEHPGVLTQGQEGKTEAVELEMQLPLLIKAG